MSALDAATARSREDWLMTLAASIAPHVERETSTIMPRIRIACGFTSGGARSKAIGECWSDDASADRTREIFIHPGESDERRVAAILTHEMIHAALPKGTGHKGPFLKAALALGFAKPVTRLYPTPAMWAWLEPIVNAMEPYPHARLNASISAKKKQTTRLLKAECGVCGYTVRVTAKWLDDAGAPYCGHVSHGRMVCEGYEAGEEDEE